MVEAHTTFRAAVVQMCSGRDLARNLDDAGDLIRQAARAGARYVQTPEVTTIMELDKDLLMQQAEYEALSKAVRFFAKLAAELGIWLHIGSMPVLSGKGGLANRSFVFSPEGEITAKYDKLHMFDCDLPNGESYRESANYDAGEVAIIAALPWGKLGLSICYDLRFPKLFWMLAQSGARFIACPAAFTRTTGEAHWHTLIRARAIETQCYVFAAAQGGIHEHGRETFGHSLIVSPWGEILAEAGVEPGFVIADIDLAAQDVMRQRLPSLKNDRTFALIDCARPADGRAVPAAINK